MEAVGQEASQSQNPFPVPLNSTVPTFVVLYNRRDAGSLSLSEPRPISEILPVHKEHHLHSAIARVVAMRHRFDNGFSHSFLWNLIGHGSPGALVPTDSTNLLSRKSTARSTRSNLQWSLQNRPRVGIVPAEIPTLLVCSLFFRYPVLGGTHVDQIAWHHLKPDFAIAAGDQERFQRWGNW